MFRYKLYLSVLAIFAFSIAYGDTAPPPMPTPGTTPVVIAYKFPLGMTLAYRLERTDVTTAQSTPSMTAHTAFGLWEKVLSVDKIGNAQVMITISNSIGIINGKNVVPPRAKEPLVIYAVISPLGKIVKSRLGSVQMDLLSPFVNVEEQTQMGVPILPSHPVKIGDTWTTTRSESKYGSGNVTFLSTLTGITIKAGHQIATVETTVHQVYDMSLSSRVSNERTVMDTTGHCEFDIDAGYLIESTGELTVHLAGNAPGKQDSQNRNTNWSAITNGAGSMTLVDVKK